MGRGPSSLHRAGFLSTKVSSGPEGQVLSGASQPEQAFKAAQPSYRDEPPKQRSTDGRLCDLCVTNEGELVETSGAWRQALWLAEKHIITRVQTLVQSPILARYAAAAYRLRQKPLGVCCLSCQQWVWESSVGPPSTGTFLKPDGPWPGAAEAAITGARFFPVDFGADEAAELCLAGRQNSKPRDGNPGATRTAGEVYQSQGRSERRSVSQEGYWGPTRRDWCRLSDIIAQEPQDCLQAKSAQLLEWIEEFESHLEPDTLGYWVANRIPECLEAEEEDSIGLLACIEDLKLQVDQPSNIGVCTLVQANVTNYRAEVKQWLVTNQCQVTCVQETHVEGPKQEGLKSGLAAGSLETWAHPAEGTQGGSMGGLATMARTHLQTRHLQTFGDQGKGCVFIGLRFQGWELAIGNVYLESGTGPGAGVSPGLLSNLAVFVQELRLPWIIVGDWNCSPEELASSGFLSMIKGRLVTPGESTTTQGSEIDYAVASEAIAACTQVEVDWDVPFKLHAAIKYKVHKKGASLPVPQAPRFAPEPGEYQAELIKAPTKEVQAMFEQPNERHAELEWGRIMQELEAQLHMDQCGRGWYFPVIREPLVPQTSPHKPWKGGRVAYWERMQLWVKQRQQRPLKPSQLRLFLKQVNQMHHYMGAEGAGDPGAIQVTLEAYMLGHGDDLHQVQEVLDNAREEACAWRAQRQKQYQEWLEGACEGGMRGLYRALKTPENSQARPYRDQSGELRPHLRRKEWKAVWKPLPGNQVQQHQVFDQLKAGAQAQLARIGPLSNEAVGRVLCKMAKKASGPDGLSAQMLRALEPDQVALVAQAFRTWEATGQMPETVTMTLVALLPKKATEERPIGLTSYAYRAWCRARYHLHEDWARQYKQHSPWDRAIKGMSSLEVAVTRVIKGEVLRQSGKTGITLLLDLKGFYENVDHAALVAAAFRHNYPPLLLHGAMQIYRGKRHLCAENMLSAPLVATTGIVAGCPLAPGLSKLIMHEVVEPLWKGPPKCHVDLYIDDTGFDVLYQDAKACARKAYLVWQRVKRQLDDAKLPLSTGKSVWICSNTRAEKELNKLLQEGDPQVQSLAKDLGVDSAWGRRRRLATHKARFRKGQQRQNRLVQLAPAQSAKTKAYKQSVFGAALYGHMAMGLAPKRLKWVRHASR